MSAASVGAAVARVGGRERVNGAQQFLGDIRLENMLHVKLVTIDVACARIDSIDTSNRSEPGGGRVRRDRRRSAAAHATIRTRLQGQARCSPTE